ncbi:MAG TPA: Gfo/Idh/MocA family oxidoreductase [Tepidisphaeraceae bacterium]|jgi:predicted dehydrogenase
MTASSHPIRMGVVGVGGYAGVICRQLLSRRGHGPIELVAACEPDPNRHPEIIAQLRQQGVEIQRDLDALLTRDIDAIWLPVPIDLHRNMTEKVLAVGKAVMVEKPAAGSVQDVDAMIAARDAQRGIVAVGFQHLYDPHLHELRQRIRQGAIGRVLSASVRACWPRHEGYYHRTMWAGRMSRAGVWVMDSPANNALAHYIAILLYLLAANESEAAEPVQVEAELYRVNNIENYDTCSLRIGLANGISILVLFTHASESELDPVTIIRGEKGVIKIDGSVEIEGIGQLLRSRQPEFEELQHNMQTAFAQRLRGIAAPIATLEMARAHTVAVNGASEASAVSEISDKFSRTIRRDGQAQRIITGIETIFEQCQLQDKMLHESGLAPWSIAAGFKNLRSYKEFLGPRIEAASDKTSISTSRAKVRL